MLAGSVIGVALVLRALGRAGVYSALTNLCSHITDERALQSEPPPPAPPGAPPPPPPAAPPPPPAAPPPPGGLVPLTLNRPPKPRLVVRLAAAALLTLTPCVLPSRRGVPSRRRAAAAISQLYNHYL